MFVNRVAVRGTWTRGSTSTEDITYARRRGRVADSTRAYGVQHLEFRAARDGTATSPPSVLFQNRHGTFVATIDVPGPLNWRRAVLLARVKTLLRWFMQDQFCRAPDFEIVSFGVTRVEIP